MATQQPTKTVILSGTFTSGPSGLVPAAPTQFIEGIFRPHINISFLSPDVTSDLPIPFGYTPDRKSSFTTHSTHLINSRRWKSQTVNSPRHRDSSSGIHASMALLQDHSTSRPLEN